MPARVRKAASRAAIMALLAWLAAHVGCSWQWPSLVFTSEGQRPDIPIVSVFPEDGEAAGLRRTGAISGAGSDLLRELLGEARTRELYLWRPLETRTAVYGYPSAVAGGGRESSGPSASGDGLARADAGTGAKTVPTGDPGSASLTGTSTGDSGATGGAGVGGGADAGATIRLTVIEFASPEAAYGALSHIRPKGLPDEACVTIGMAGFLDGNLVAFADAWFVAIAAAPVRSMSLRPLVLELARVAARRIPGVGIPKEIEALPVAGRRPGTEVYEHERFFNMYGTEGWARAAYMVEGVEAEAFVIRRETKDGAKWILGRLRAMCEAEGACKPIPVGEEGFLGSLKGRPLAAARTHTGVYCVAGALPEDKIVSMMRDPDRMFRALAPPRRKPSPPKKDDEKEEGGGPRTRLPFSLGM
ncbi:MAG: hypothetical protein N3A38_04635 [Planctomycetota bacterium]|nr:hypothetical protein [Planctomycetota bacterium]